MNYIKYFGLFVIVIASVYLFIHQVDKSTSDSNNSTYIEYNDQNTSQETQSLNTVPDFFEYNRINSLIGIFLSPYIAFGIIFSMTIFSFFFLRLYEKFYGIILFGIYSAIVLTFIVNLVLYMNFETWSIHFIMKYFFMTLAFALVSSLFLTLIHSIINIQKVLKSEFATITDWMFGRYVSPNVNISANLAKSFLLTFAIISSIVIYILISQ